MPTREAPMGGEAPAMEVAESVSKLWWLYLAAGVVWTLYGMLILSLRPAALVSLAILAGIAFILGGISQFMQASRADSWRWLWIVGGILGIAAGIVAFVWPGPTLFVLSVFVAWYLVISGIFTIVASLASVRRNLWWVGLIIGALEIVLGMWAISSPGREVLLLVNLIGIGMILYGVTEIFAAFSVRKLPELVGEAQATRGRGRIPGQGRSAPA
ncbi:HdeD family acid-resistance protein [Actinopolymorpha sp. NPDC004070]|uniref:HdeD family acid-resistance protein n=1 Tax=Actinopolymorpha sp. NPDC004070 TaxID=3154548 RepID=UPI00339E7383